MSAKKRLVGFNAPEDLAARLKERAEELGLTVSDYLKGLVNQDLTTAETPPVVVAVMPLPEAAVLAVRKPKPAEPSAPLVLPEKRLALDLLTLTAWYLGFLRVLHYVHPADVSLVAKHYTSAEDTTKPAALRQAMRQAGLEATRETWNKLVDSARRLRVWCSQLDLD